MLSVALFTVEGTDIGLLTFLFFSFLQFLLFHKFFYHRYLMTKNNLSVITRMTECQFMTNVGIHLITKPRSLLLQQDVIERKSRSVLWQQDGIGSKTRSLLWEHDVI